MLKYLATITGAISALATVLAWWSYTTDVRFATQVNSTLRAVLIFAGVAIGLVLFVRYGLPAFWQSAESWSRLQDARVERHIKLSRYAPSATGLYEIPAQQMDARLFLQAMQLATLHSQYEEPMITTAPPALLPSASSALTLPDEVRLRDYRHQAGNRFALGVKPDGELLTLALPDVWHLLNNAQSGGGKSNNIDSFITQVHYLPHGNAVEMYGMDFKGELRATWKRSPLFVELATQAELGAMVEMAQGLVSTIHERNRTFEAYADASGRIIKGYRDYTRLSGAALPLIYLVVDEMNALMSYAKKDARLESALGVLLQMGRSAGVNVLMGAQHLTADVLPKGYYTNIATRVMLGAYDASNTTRLLGSKPAAELLPLVTGQPGRALVRANGSAAPVVVQMLRVDEQDMLDSMQHARTQHAGNGKTVFPATESGNTFSQEIPNQPDSELLGELLENAETLSDAGKSVFPAAEHATAENIDQYDRKRVAVKYMRSEGRGKVEIIRQIWGVKSGRAYRAASAEYDAIAAQLDNDAQQSGDAARG